LKSFEIASDTTLPDIFHATAQSSLRLAPMDINNRFVASVAALRESKMSSSVLWHYESMRNSNFKQYQTFEQFQTTIYPEKRFVKNKLNLFE
jgi:hypothetical protein